MWEVYFICFRCGKFILNLVNFSDMNSHVTHVRMRTSRSYRLAHVKPAGSTRRHFDFSFLGSIRV